MREDAVPCVCLFNVATRIAYGGAIPQAKLRRRVRRQPFRHIQIITATTVVILLAHGLEQIVIAHALTSVQMLIPTLVIGVLYGHHLLQTLLRLLGFDLAGVDAVLMPLQFIGIHVFGVSGL